jgi:Family of unknown function (DUF6527)
MKRRPLWWRRMTAALTPRRSLHVVEGDMVPEKLPPWKLVLARDGDEDWAVGLRCPCGCGQRLEMMLLKEVKPCWDLSVDRHGHAASLGLAARRMQIAFLVAIRQDRLVRLITG